jgi:hypothetical protein
LRRVEVVKAREVPEVLPRRKPVVEAGLFGQNPDGAAQSRVVQPQRVARDDGIAIGRRDEGGEHSDRRGLPRPVGPEEAEHGACFDGQRQAVDGDAAVEPAGQSVRLDRVSHASTGR